MIAASTARSRVSYRCAQRHIFVVRAVPSPHCLRFSVAGMPATDVDLALQLRPRDSEHCRCPSSFRCSTRSASSSDRARRCTSRVWYLLRSTALAGMRSFGLAKFGATLNAKRCDASPQVLGISRLGWFVTPVPTGCSLAPAQKYIFALISSAWLLGLDSNQQPSG